MPPGHPAFDFLAGEQFEPRRRADDLDHFADGFGLLGMAATGMLSDRREPVMIEAIILICADADQAMLVVRAPVVAGAHASLPDTAIVADNPEAPAARQVEGGLQDRTGQRPQMEMAADRIAKLVDRECGDLIE